MKEPSFTLGVEEEYLLVDPETGELVEKLPAQMLEQCEALAEGQQVKPEFLRSQIEIGTRICRNVGEVRDSLKELRLAVIEVARRHGLAPIAVSTHPFAHWQAQKHTARSRYDALSEEFQATANRLLICGMHVHVGIEDDELRIDLLNQASYFLPHLLALSTSSPFWEGMDTGLKSYRVTVFDTLPRTGQPERLTSFAEFERLVGVLVKAVGHSTERTLPDARDEDHGCLHGRRRCRLPRGARAVHHAHALAVARRQPPLAQLSADADRREPLARDALQLRQGSDRSRSR